MISVEVADGELGGLLVISHIFAAGRRITALYTLTRIDPGSEGESRERMGRVVGDSVSGVCGVGVISERKKL